MSVVYDMFWVHPIVLPKMKVLYVAQSTLAGKVLNVISTPKTGVPAAVLYPAFMTPEVAASDDSIELLLLTKRTFSNKRQLQERINWQLKFTVGLTGDRPYSTGPLFVTGDLSKLIKIDAEWDLSNETIFATGEGGKGRFRGRLDDRIAKLYADAGFNTVFAVTLDRKALESVNLAGNAYPERKHTLALANGYTIQAPIGDKDDQDRVLWDATKSEKLDAAGHWAFKVGSRDIEMGEADRRVPMLAYHPLVINPKDEPLGVGHMGDIHVTARQLVLAESKAKVIHHQDIPTVGSLVNVCSARVKTIFDKMGSDSDVDVLIIGGDFGDYCRTMYLKDFQTAKQGYTVKKIWDLCKITDESDAGIPNYHYYFDLISVWSFAREFYNSAKKPVFAITGNHDAYDLPFGVSPRVASMEEGSIKGNEGIPADHNMTIYECILAMGKDFGKVLASPEGKEAASLRSNPDQAVAAMFNPKLLIWFYAMNTPWADFAAFLPRQILIGLAWGSIENMISLSNWEQGMGHLPRSPDGVTDKQLELLNGVVGDNKAAGDKKKSIVLTTHFTFASFLERHAEAEARDPAWGKENKDPLDPKEKVAKGWIFTSHGFLGKGPEFSIYDMGTFEKNRDKVYQDLILKPRKQNKLDTTFEVILTGHSHRRAVYTLRDQEVSPKWGSDSVLVDYTDFPNFKDESDHRLTYFTKEGDNIVQQPRRGPWIVLSDSGGPVPRMNKFGEFQGWGSDEPAGTKITFDENAQVASITPVKTNLKPRFAVAMDYFDVMACRGPASEMKKYGGVVADTVGGPVGGVTRWAREKMSKLVIESFKSGHADLDPGGSSPAIDFTLTLHSEFDRTYRDHIEGVDKPIYAGLSVARLKLYYTVSDNSGKMYGINFDQVSQGFRVSKWKLSSVASQLMMGYAAGRTNRSVFLAVWFGADSTSWWRDVYDFSSPWTFEVDIDVSYEREYLVKKVGKRYEISRVRVEIPDFDGRSQRHGYDLPVPKE
ncbi:MAG: metallophosphoesterase [Planctomycetota bacterium]|nr:metallophosphoesterase [Planctomycetota bacterium]